jgi:GT2 family glycosyltransferase
MSPVDVMVPYFDRPQLLQQAVRSLLDQDDPDWCLTVVDDGPGADDVQVWLESHADPRVRYLHNGRNLGINRNFQRCLDLAEHDVTVIMGADDVMLPNYVSTVRAAFHRFPGVSMVQPGVRVIDEHGASATGLADLAKRRLFAPRVREPTVLGGQDLAAGLLRGNWLYFPSVAWRTEAARSVGFREGLDVVQDLALVLDLVTRGRTMLVDPQVCFHYRRHSTSVSAWRAADGSRFAEERAFFGDEAIRMRQLGWTKAATAARGHLSSRINALTLLPASLRAGHGAWARSLARHVLERP